MKNIKTIEELKTELITINSKIAEIEKEQKKIYEIRNRKLNSVRCKINESYKNADFKKMGANPFPHENAPRVKMVFVYNYHEKKYYIDCELYQYYLDENLDRNYLLEKIPFPELEFQGLVAELSLRFDNYEYRDLDEKIQQQRIILKGNENDLKILRGE